MQFFELKRQTIRPTDYFEQPTQVIAVPQGEAPIMGIAYGNDIICACCGGVYRVDEVELVKVYKDWQDLVEEPMWCNDYDEIYGDWLSAQTENE